MAPYRIPGDAFLVVMAANLVYVAIPQIIAMRCTENPNFFLTVSSFPGQTGLPYSKEKDTLITNKIKSS